MRKITFRGKSKDTKLWEYGNLLYKKRTNSKASEIYESYYIQRVNFHLELEVIPESIGQFTGLYDKNGKEIYEGDIVIYEVFNTPHICKFNEEEACFDLQSIDSEYVYSMNNFQVLEVIGNIYENSELLKENEGNEILLHEQISNLIGNYNPSFSIILKYLPNVTELHRENNKFFLNEEVVWDIEKDLKYQQKETLIYILKNIKI